MKNMLEEVKRFFEVTPKDEIKRIIDECIAENTVGPTVQEYDLLLERNKHWEYVTPPSNEGYGIKLTSNLPENKIFGFFLITYGKSSFFIR